MIPWSSNSRGLEDRFGDFCREAQYEGSLVPEDMFTESELNRLLDLGYIYKVRNKDRYRILHFPEKIISSADDE